MLGLWNKKRSEEEQMIEGVRKGDMQMQRKLYDTFASPMLAVCRMYTKDINLAEDMLQESFIKIFDKIGSYRGDGNLGGWIRRIVVNTAINQYHKQNRMHPVIDSDQIPDIINEKDESDILNNDFTLNELYMLIDSLPDRYKVVFNMYAIENYSHREIAQSLNMSEGTSKSLLSRARQMLREHMSELNKQRSYAGRS